MTVASGQMPYEYDGKVPIRASNSQPMGISGSIVEQGMFVLSAELRKWNRASNSFVKYDLYKRPDVAAVEFEPTPNGDSLENGPGLITINEIEQMRSNLDTLFNQYENDSVYSLNNFKESWLTNAYRESASGYLHFVDLGFLTTSVGADYLRPILESVVGGDDMLDTNLHWLAGSGIFLDIDFGEVIFQPFPFLREDLNFAPSAGNMRFNFSPIYPLLQTTTGGLPSVNVARYEADLANGTVKQDTNFSAIASGKHQVDGYALLAGTTFNLVTGNDSSYFPTLAATGDFTDFINGARAVDDGNGLNDFTARGYITAKAQPSGLYRVAVTNKEGDVPNTAIPSGYVSFWPQADIRINQTNREYVSSLSGLNDGSLMITSADSVGYHVLDDALWMTGPNAALSGTDSSRGLYVVSPYNGDIIWYRPAQRVPASYGDRPTGSSPGIFGVHVGLEEFGTDFIRVSKTWGETYTDNMSPTSDNYVNTVYFQRYDKTTLDHTETSVTWSIDSDLGTLGGNASSVLDGLFFDGTDYWTYSELGFMTRYTSALVFDGHFEGSNALRRFYAGGDYLYTHYNETNLTAGDPLRNVLPTPTVHIGSGIGKWAVISEPVPIDGDTGTYLTGSAKMIRAENHVGHQGTAIVHCIRDVSGGSHVADGIWCLIQYQAEFPSSVTGLYLLRIEEGASSWNVLESIKLSHTPSPRVSSTTPPTDFPYEFILHDID
jgi:hypothetical protein